VPTSDAVNFLAKATSTPPAAVGDPAADFIDIATSNRSELTVPTRVLEIHLICKRTVIHEQLCE
jgi:hypothetical protein